MDETDRQINEHNWCGKYCANIKHKKLGNEGFLGVGSGANIDWKAGQWKVREGSQYMEYQRLAQVCQVDKREKSPLGRGNNG